MGSMAPIRNVDLSTNNRGRGHDAIKGDDIDFRPMRCGGSESLHRMSPTDDSIVIYNHHVMPVVIMMVFGMHHHISLVSDNDFVSLYEGVQVPKERQKETKFSLPSNTAAGTVDQHTDLVELPYSHRARPNASSRTLQSDDLSVDPAS